MRGFLHLIFAVAAGIAAGWISAVSLIENYGFEEIEGQPQWKERRNASDHPAAPYAFGYFINQGQVPPPLTSHHYVRSVDNDGNRLRNDCIYLLQGRIPPSRRWSLSVAGNDGSASTLSAGEAIYEADGSVKVYFAAFPVPGNRVVLPASGPAVVALTVHDPVKSPNNLPPILPGISKVRC